MAEIKGALLKAWSNLLNERFGQDAVNKAMAGLSLEDQRLLSAPFLDSSWYPYDSLHALRKLTRPLTTRADRDFSKEIGRQMAQYTFTGVYKSLLANDPVKQVEKFSWIQEFFFRDTRKLKTETTGPMSCIVRYTYEAGAAPTKAICMSLVGFWSRTLELAGAEKLQADHPKCILGGSTACEFTFQWSSTKS